MIGPAAGTPKFGESDGGACALGREKIRSKKLPPPGAADVLGGPIGVGGPIAVTPGPSPPPGIPPPPPKAVPPACTPPLRPTAGAPEAVGGDPDPRRARLSAPSGVGRRPWPGRGAIKNLSRPAKRLRVDKIITGFLSKPFVMEELIEYIHDKVLSSTETILCLTHDQWSYII